MRGVADYVPAAIATAANFTDAYYARLGATIAPGGVLTVSATPVGTCAIDNFKMWVSYIRIDPNVEHVNLSCSWKQLPIRKTTNLGALGVFNLDRFTGGDVVGNVSYRFRIGSTIIPSSYVTAGAESRMEPMRAMGMQLPESTARTCVSGADYLSTAFVIGVSLQCFPMTEAMGDGLLVDSTIILEMNLGTAQTSAIRLDAFVQLEKSLVFANGAIMFDA
ncbi:hypothetical protein T492DRAFT_843907 [Pavlovales sp. CCMP2436]|nr:hypothetical protein T492DRAFT_843907 [Pavlovales sp. CCMP2436]